jgi:hypothetical protein
MAIYKKLLDFQKLNISVKKDRENSFFKSNYATLNEVLGKIREPLNKLNIVIVQIPQSSGLVTKLIDTEDDTFVEAFMPYVETTTPQKLGSCNTYNRRYSLVTLLGLEDDDDDGNVASNIPATGTFQKTKSTNSSKKNYDQRYEEMINQPDYF